MWLAWLASCLVAGCGGPGPAGGSTSAEVPRAPRALVDFVPADARGVLVLRPAELMARPEWEDVLAIAFPEAQREAFRERFVLRARDVREAAIVERPDGTLTFLRGDYSEHEWVEVMGRRMNTVVGRGTDPPQRVGFLGPDLREVVALDVGTVGYASPPGEVLGEVARAPRAPTGLLAASLGALGETPLRYVRLEPLELPLDSPLGLVLAQHRAFGVSLGPGTDPEIAEIEVAVVGEFPETAESNVESVALALLRSDLGRVLLGSSAAESLRVERGEEILRVRVQAPVPDIARGLSALFVDEIEGIVGDSVF